MKKSKRKGSLWLYIPFWLFMALMFMGLVVMQLQNYSGYRRELDRLNAELAAEKQIAVDLRYQEAFIGSDAYIEQLAREMLGFVRQDEIVFRNIAE